MDFGQALEKLKLGVAVYREGWNSTNQYVYYVEAASYPAKTQVAKTQFGDTVPYRAYLAFKTVGADVVPWVASQTDLLATDWREVN